MCFSAPGSFILGTALIGSGAYSIRNVKKREYLPLAITPILFGIQQLMEGGVWLALAAQSIILTRIFALGFVFFAFFLWPAWAPFFSRSIEPVSWRKRMFNYFMWAGIVFGAFFYILHIFYCNTLNPQVINHSISYDSQVTILVRSYQWELYLIYFVIVAGPLLLSSLPRIRIFGLLTMIGVAVTVLFFFYAFSSVWCFFAAIISFYIIWIIKKSNGDITEIKTPDK